jgi:hypothetical protein
MVKKSICKNVINRDHRGNPILAKFFGGVSALAGFIALIPIMVVAGAVLVGSAVVLALGAMELRFVYGGDEEARTKHQWDW